MPAESYEILDRSTLILFGATHLGSQRMVQRRTNLRSTKYSGYRRSTLRSQLTLPCNLSLISECALLVPMGTTLRRLFRTLRRNSGQKVVPRRRSPCVADKVRFIADPSHGKKARTGVCVCFHPGGLAL